MMELSHTQQIFHQKLRLRPGRYTFLPEVLLETHYRDLQQTILYNLQKFIYREGNVIFSRHTVKSVDAMYSAIRCS